MGQYNTRNKEEGLKSNGNKYYFVVIVFYAWLYYWLNIILDPIRDLPLELSLAVLSHLDATDLCLAGCVWNDLAHDEMLWMG
jgi:F-box protein 8